MCTSTLNWLNHAVNVGDSGARQISKDVVMFSGIGSSGGLGMQSASAAAVLALSMPALTTAAVQFKTMPGRGGYVFAKTSHDGSTRYWSLYLSSSSKEARVYATAATAEGALTKVTLRFKVDLTDGKLHKVLLVKDGASIWLVVDGNTIAPDSMPAITEGSLQDCDASGPECVVYIGQRASSSISGGAYRFAGFIESLQSTNAVP